MGTQPAGSEAGSGQLVPKTMERKAEERQCQQCPKPSPGSRNGSVPVLITPLWVYVSAADSRLHQAVAAVDLYSQKG